MQRWPKHKMEEKPLIGIENWHIRYTNKYILLLINEVVTGLVCKFGLLI